MSLRSSQAIYPGQGDTSDWRRFCFCSWWQAWEVLPAPSAGRSLRGSSEWTPVGLSTGLSYNRAPGFPQSKGSERGAPEIEASFFYNLIFEEGLITYARPCTQSEARSPTQAQVKGLFPSVPIRSEAPRGLLPQIAHACSLFS